MALVDCYIIFGYPSTDIFLYCNSQEATAEKPALGGAADIAQHRLYIGSVNFDLTEDDLKQVLEPFGAIEFVKLHRDPETGKSKGFAFVQ